MRKIRKNQFLYLILIKIIYNHGYIFAINFSKNKYCQYTAYINIYTLYYTV
jgi:hypothetical protein